METEEQKTGEAWKQGYALVSFPVQFGNVSSPCFLLGEGLWFREELQTLLQSDGTRMSGTGRGIPPAVLQEEERERRRVVREVRK